MLRRPEADRAERSRARPRDGSRTKRDRLAGADRKRRRHGREPAQSSAPRSAPATPAEKRRSRSPGTSAQQQEDEITPPAIAAGTIVSPAGAGPSKTPVRSRIPLIDQRQHVDRVEEDEEGDHPRGRLLARHPGLAQRPVGEDDPAGAAGREQPRRRQARHRDLVATRASVSVDVPRRRRRWNRAT